MSDADRRSFRVALVADRYVNPRSGGIDAMPVLLECGWGAIQLPSDRYSKETAALMLEQVAEQTQEFHRRGYQLVLIGRRAGLDGALAAAGVRRLERLEPSTSRELRTFLRRHARGRVRLSAPAAGSRQRQRGSRPSP